MERGGETPARGREGVEGGGTVTEKYEGWARAAKGEATRKKKRAELRRKRAESRRMRTRRRRRKRRARRAKKGFEDSRGEESSGWVVE